MPLFRNFLEKRPKKRKRESRQTAVGSSDPWIPAPLTRATAHVQHGLRVRGITNPRLFVEPVDDFELLIRAREPGPVEPLAPPALIHVGDYRGLEELGYAPVPFPVRGGGGLGRLARIGLALRELRKGVQDRGAQLGRRIDRLGGRAWEGGAGQGKSLEKSTRRSARTSLGRMVRSKNEDVFVASYLHDEQAIFSGGPTTGPPSLLTSKSSTSEHTGHVIGTASIGRRAVRRDDEATARLRPLRATRDGRRATNAAALRSTRPPLPSTFAILRLQLHATRGWPQDLSSKIRNPAQACLSSELEPFLSVKASCPGGQGSFRRTRMRGVRARALVAQQRGGMLALIGPRRLARRCLPPNFDRNPQNVPDSDVRPSPAMAPEEVSEGPALSRPSCARSPGDTDESFSIITPRRSSRRSWRPCGPLTSPGPTTVSR